MLQYLIKYIKYLRNQKKGKTNINCSYLLYFVYYLSARKKNGRFVIGLK